MGTNGDMKIKCIYCLKDKAASEYQKREHVMPQGYGTFTPDNLILNETVCDDCNQYFGEKLELYLGRDTIEGVMRYLHGIKPRKFPKTHSRLKFIIPEGELKGMIVIPRYSGVDGECNIEPALQVGFFKKNKEEYDYFEPQQIPSAKELIEKGYAIKEKKNPLIANNKEDLKYLLKILKERGMDIKLVEDIEWPEYVKERNKTLVKGTARIDQIIYRGFSKIAFNYLAYVAGKNFTLIEDFNGIRNFIRFGEGNSNDFFDVNVPSILRYDQILKRYNLKETNGHLIIAEWNGMNLVSKLSIFNIQTYLIKLCKHFKGVWRPISVGHLFDVSTGEVSPLIGISRRILLP